MPKYFFTAFEVDSSYFYSDAKSQILSRDTLQIEDGVDDALHRTVEDDPGNDQSFSFSDESAVTDYLVEYLDFAQVNGSGPEYELYAMEVQFEDGSIKHYVMSKDENFAPEIGDDLAVTNYSTFTSTDYGEIGAAVCYVKGTKIRTIDGEVPVEHLKVGDMVQTKDNGSKEILWICTRFVNTRELHVHRRLRPILIREGALGNNAPLLVSPQHRLLISKSSPLGNNFGTEIYVKAVHFSEYFPRLARIANGKRKINYYHVLLSSHEVLFANNAQSESFFPGSMALRGISRMDRAKLISLFPNLKPGVKSACSSHFKLARPMASRRETQLMSRDLIA